MTNNVQVNLDLPAGMVGGDFGGAFSSGSSVVPARDATSVTVTATDATPSAPFTWSFVFAYGNFPNRRSNVTTPVPAGPVTFTVTASALSTEVFTADSIWTSAFPVGIPVGTQVTLAGGSLPSGLSAATPYYVVTTALGSFSLSATAGGSAITCGGAGSGTFTVTQYNYTGLLAATQARASHTTSLPFPSGTATAGYVVTADDNGSPVWAVPKPPQVNYITAAGNTQYVIPAGAQTIDVTLVGGAGQGGSGAFAVSGAVGGGTGGGAGGYSRQQFQASQLTSPVTVTVGAGGSALGAPVTSASAGNIGSVGNSSLFGPYLWAHGGAAGLGGSATNGATNGGGAGAGMISGSAGGPAVTTVAIGGAGVASTTSGGGAGGGVAGTTVAVGSNGGTIANIATWANPSAGVLSVASIAGLPTSGTVVVAASGATFAIVTYTGVSGATLTGCAYVSGSPAGTVATGGTVLTALGGGGAAAPFIGTTSNSAAGGSPNGGASPTNGSVVGQAQTAPGGGGGASTVTGSAQQGANAQANTGAGGGGGGACLNATTSGAGGNGGSGYALIIAYFQ